MGDRPEVPFEVPICANGHDAHEMAFTKYRGYGTDDRMYCCTTCGREMQVYRRGGGEVVYNPLRSR